MTKKKNPVGRPKKEDVTVITIRTDNETKDRFKAFAASRGLSLSDLMKKATDYFIKNSA